MKNELSKIQNLILINSSVKFKLTKNTYTCWKMIKKINRMTQATSFFTLIFSINLVAGRVIADDMRVFSGSNKELVELPNLSQLTEINEVHITNTSIEELDFSMLPPGIERLDLSNNNISRIAHREAHLPKLKMLNLSGNQLNNQSILFPKEVSLPSLEELHLSSNPIVDIIDPSTFSTFKKLQTLAMDRTNLLQINEFVLAPLEELRVLNISGNRLQVLPDKLFSHNQKLATLDLANNSLRGVPPAIRSISSIETLVLDGNLITSLRNQNFINQTSLSHLSIRSCPLLERIYDLAFSDMPKLRAVYLNNNNKLSSISNQSFASYDEQDLERITRVNLTTMVEISTDVAFYQLSLRFNPDTCKVAIDWQNDFGIYSICVTLLKHPVDRFIKEIDCEISENLRPLKECSCFVLYMTMVIFATFCAFLVGEILAETIKYTRRRCKQPASKNSLPPIGRARDHDTDATRSETTTDSLVSTIITMKSNLRRHTYLGSTICPQATKSQIENYADSCTICLDHMSSGRVLPCGHIFHEECLVSWLSTSSELKSCPKCRVALGLSCVTVAVIISEHKPQHVTLPAPNQ